MTKQEILQEIASAIGGLDIALRRMTEEGLREDVRAEITRLAQLVHDESTTAIWISGYGVTGGQDEGTK